jgi:indolepyruvate ferredoxin oxidoreductase, alpha subunit
MTGQQEHPGTGRTLGHEPTNRVKIEDVCKAIGVHHVDVIDPIEDPAGFEKLLTERLSVNQLSVIIARRPCILAAGKIRKYEQEAKACQECANDPA